MTDTEKIAQPPLTTRECADFIGVTTDYIVNAIKAGELKADDLRAPGARNAVYRVHEDDFVAFLKTRKWSRLPKTGTD